MSNVIIKSTSKYGGWISYLRKRLGVPGKNFVNVGILEKSKYTGEDGGAPAGTPIASIAAIHEFGTKDVPARSFLRSTAEEKKGEFRDIAKAYLSRNDTKGTDGALTAVGMFASKEMQKKIQDGISPALKPDTISKKRKIGLAYSSTPVLATGQLQRAIDYELER